MSDFVLKDLYAMGGFHRNTLFSMIIVCMCFGFSLGAEGVTAATAIMCATMIVSTFALDEKCGWHGFAVVSFGISMVFGFIIIPIMFSFGAEKARFIMMAVIALPTIVVYLLAEKVNLSGIELTYAGMKLLYIAVIIGFLLLGQASCEISIRIYSKKEF